MRKAFQAFVNNKLWEDYRLTASADNLYVMSLEESSNHHGRWEPLAATWSHSRPRVGRAVGVSTPMTVRLLQPSSGAKLADSVMASASTNNTLLRTHASTGWGGAERMRKGHAAQAENPTTHRRRRIMRLPDGHLRHAA